MAKLNWYKGSLHNHTNRSDGDSDPRVVVDWYRRNGYHFMAITDHNCVTTLEDAGILLIPSEEMTLRIDGGETAIHLNAYGVDAAIAPVQAGDPASALQANINVIVRGGGIAAINHPNYTWAFNHTHMLQVTGAELLEIQNCHPVVNTHGGGGRPSCEEMWDPLLSAGQRIYGIACDDSHTFQGDFLPTKGNPGHGWVVVRASRLERKAILKALREGNFYASTGVTLKGFDAAKERVAIQVEQERDFAYTTRFIGRQGAVLGMRHGVEAEYRPKGGEGYVRAVVSCSNGSKAWTQPVFLSP
jgi:hypothetical protein